MAFSESNVNYASSVFSSFIHNLWPLRRSKPKLQMDFQCCVLQGARAVCAHAHVHLLSVLFPHSFLFLPPLCPGFCLSLRLSVGLADCTENLNGSGSKEEDRFSFFLTKTSQDPYKLGLLRCSSTRSGRWIPLPWTPPLPDIPCSKKATEYQTSHLHPS